MTPAIQLVRNMGLARMPLVGGRYDGGEWVAVVGAPVCVPVKPAPTKQEATQPMGIRYFAAAGPIEGEEWKNGGDSTKGRPENCTQRFALYAPKIENDRASLALYFVEEIEL